jgi:hypothetical protein
VGNLIHVWLAVNDWKWQFVIFFTKSSPGRIPFPGSGLQFATRIGRSRPIGSLSTKQVDSGAIAGRRGLATPLDARGHETF